MDRGTRVSVPEFRRILSSLNGKGYGAYKRLYGYTINFGRYEASLTHIQGDPHAPPSVIEFLIPPSTHKFPKDFFRNKNSVPFTDYLVRRLYRAAKARSSKCGLGNSCMLGIPRPSPRVLRRSSVEVYGENIVIRFFIGLPASGRRILGREASKLILEKASQVVDEVLSARDEEDRIREAVKLYRLQEGVRDWLRREGYVFFVGNGSVLPRKASFSDEPLPTAIRFRSPKRLRKKICVKDAGCVEGMAVPAGVNVITGGAYHGKTTLLEALQDGIYNHVKGDGREHVISLDDTILVRAEDGRIVNNVDISTFIKRLPDGTDTSVFSTLDASGSTSMAASLSEAIEMGAKHILMDEDISATNLMYKDESMAKLLPDDPITPLNSLIKPLHRELGISTTTVVSASSSFILPSDKIILMRRYVPLDATEEARKLLQNNSVAESHVKKPRQRLFHGVRRLRRIKASGMKIIAEYDNGPTIEINLRNNPRFVEEGQATFAAKIIMQYTQLREPRPLKDLMAEISKRFDSSGFSAFLKKVPPNLTEVSPIDVLWIINRLYGTVFI